MKSTIDKIKYSESGVTLLISVLVMSGLTLVTLAIAAFAVQEIRASRAVIASEPAITAAESAGEEGLWAIKRNTSISPCPTLTTVNLANGSVVNTCKAYTGSKFSIAGGATGILFYLFDPLDNNGDIDLQGCSACAAPLAPSTLSPTGYLYASMTVKHLTPSGNSVTVTITRLDGTPVASQTIPPGTTGTLNLPAPAPGSEGRMKVTIVGPTDATVEVDTFKGDGTELGLPNFPVVDSTGCSSKAVLANCNIVGPDIFTRRLKVDVPQ